MPLALLLLSLFAAPVLVLAVGRRWPRVSGPLSAAIGAGACVGIAWVWRHSATFTLRWIPSWGVELRLGMDGLAALYALLAAGVGFAVIVYALGYMPPHQEARGSPPRDDARFYALMLLFMASMVGLVVAQELYALMIFWDLTAVVSFLLIGTNRREAEARAAALTALIVTGGSAVLLLLAIVLLHASTGTTTIAGLADRVAAGPGLDAAALMIVLAALAKSAQVPLHFWLPRAMVAPTPVSAYLHSAAMVAAGVFLLSRLHPLLSASRWALPAIAAVGLLSILTGSVMALGAQPLKRVLAYSTVAQYGYVMALLGLGGDAAAAASCFYVVAHGVAKSALFMTAGVVTDALQGSDRLSDIAGLGRRLPGVAVASGIAAAALSGLPLTIGFFKDELFYRAAIEHGPAASACAVAAAALTFAYTWRWWTGIFLGPATRTVRAPSALTVVSLVALAATALAGGVSPGMLAGVVEGAAAAIAGSPVPVDVAYRVSWRTEYTMAAAAVALGSCLLWAWRALEPRVSLAGLHALGRCGPARLAGLAAGWLDAASDVLHDIEVRDLRDRVTAVLAPGGGLVILALLSRVPDGGWRVGPLDGPDLPLACALALAAFAAAVAVRSGPHLSLVIALSTVSYSMAIVFAAFGAPDVALVTVLIQTVLTLLLVAVLSLFRTDIVRRAARSAARPRRFAVVAWLAGASAFGMTWSILSWPASAETPEQYLRLAPAAHAGDVVTGVLADFRGLDTMGEATVIAIALVGVATLLRRAGER